MTATPSRLYPEVAAVIRTLTPDHIADHRKQLLQPLIEFIQIQAHLGQPIRLNLICTHNSRRSHLAQIWAQTAAAYFNIRNVFCYSGGTEATAMAPMVAATLVGSGFKINAISGGDNPVYTIKYAENDHPIVAFSKSYFDDFNPVGEFAAIMTCSQADGGCPFIAGATKRIAVTYEDPKAYDGGPQQAAQYRATSLLIATEMVYVFSQIKQ